MSDRNAAAAASTREEDARQLSIAGTEARISPAKIKARRAQQNFDNLPLFHVQNAKPSGRGNTNAT